MSLLIRDIFDIIWTFLDDNSRRFITISSKLFARYITPAVINCYDFILPLSNQMITWLIQHSFPKKEWLMTRILIWNSYEIIQYAIYNGYMGDYQRYNHLIVQDDNNDILSLFHNNGMNMSKELILVAANYNSPRCLYYIYMNGINLDNDILNIAIDNYSYQCINFLVNTNILPKTDEIIERAVCSGDVNLVALFHKLEYPFSLRLTNIAIALDNVNCLRYLIENGIDYNSIDTLEAVNYGSIKCLKYLHSIGCDIHPQAAVTAVITQNFRCFEYIKQNGGQWNTSLATEVAQGLNTSAMMYLIETGCPIDTNVLINAYIAGYSQNVIQAIINKLNS